MNLTLLRDSRRRLLFFDLDRIPFGGKEVLTVGWIGLGPVYIRTEVQRIDNRWHWRIDWGAMTRHWGGRLTIKGWRVVE